MPIYHLQRLGIDCYKCTPKGRGAVPYEVVIEDAIMKPLISGPEAKRYEEPETNTYLLFPYQRDTRGAMRLISAGNMESRFPRAWAHLCRWERELRKRESNSFDDENWYRFGRSQNIDKQDVAKLIVPRLVQHMKEVAAIEADERALNETLYGLYRLSPEERNLVENELGRRNVATATA